MNEELRTECFKALHCLYIAVERNVADDATKKITAYIEVLESENLDLRKKALTT